MILFESKQHNLEDVLIFYAGFAVNHINVSDLITPKLSEGTSRI